MYIRTKDGVYVLSEAYWAGNKDDILKQSETKHAQSRQYKRQPKSPDVMRF